MTGRQETPTLEKRSVSQGVPGRRSRPGSGGATPRRRTPFILQLFGVVLVLSSVIVGLSASHAGAATLSNGTVAIRTVPSGSLATNPLHDQDTVELVVAPNSTLSRSSLETAGFPSGAAVIKVLECADLDGSAANLPKKSTDCDPTTTFPTANLQENGSVFVSKYKVYALPDESVLGPSNGTVCDDAEHQCVLGFFSNQNDFTKPYPVFGAVPGGARHSEWNCVCWNGTLSELEFGRHAGLRHPRERRPRSPCLQPRWRTPVDQIGGRGC